MNSIKVTGAHIKESFLNTAKVVWTHKETLAKIAFTAGVLGTALYFRKPLQENLSALWERPLDPCHPEVQYPPSSFIKETLVHEKPVSYYASFDKQVEVVQPPTDNLPLESENDISFSLKLKSYAKTIEKLSTHFLKKVLLPHTANIQRLGVGIALIQIVKVLKK